MVMGTPKTRWLNLFWSGSIITYELQEGRNLTAKGTSTLGSHSKLPDNGVDFIALQLAVSQSNVWIIILFAFWIKMCGHSWPATIHYDDV